MLDRLSTWIAKRYLVVFTSLLGASLAGAYFLNQAQLDFWSGVLVTVGAGSFIAILIPLFIIDPLQRIKQDREWRNVRKNAIHAIARHLCDFGNRAWMRFTYVADDSAMNKINAGRDEPNKETIEGFKGLADQFRKYEGAKRRVQEGPEDKTPGGWAIYTYDDSEVRYNLDSIRDIWTPRVMKSCNNQDLIDKLIEFDNTRSKLHYSKLAYEDMMVRNPVGDMANLLEKAGEVYNELKKEWEEIN